MASAGQGWFTAQWTPRGAVCVRAGAGSGLAAHIAALVALGLAILVAIIVYGMPVDQTLLSASEGAVFGLFPIMWIVWTAIWIYNMTEATGHFAVLTSARRWRSRP
jgi:L-lactate permease